MGVLDSLAGLVNASLDELRVSHADPSRALRDAAKALERERSRVALERHEADGRLRRLKAERLVRLEEQERFQQRAERGAADPESAQALNWAAKAADAARLLETRESREHARRDELVALESTLLSAARTAAAKAVELGQQLGKRRARPRPVEPPPARERSDVEEDFDRLQRDLAVEARLRNLRRKLGQA